MRWIFASLVGNTIRLGNLLLASRSVLSVARRREPRSREVQVHRCIDQGQIDRDEKFFR